MILLVQLYVLFAGETVGLSDNGDFARVMKPNYIMNKIPAAEKRFVFVDDYYLEPEGSTVSEKLMNAALKLRDPMSYPSLQLLFIKAAITVNIVVNKLAGKDPFIFSLGVQGVLFCIMYTAALALLLDSLELKGIWLDMLFKVIVIIVFCDIGYIAYFNSFYGEAPQLILFILTAALGLRLVKYNFPTWSIVFFCASVTAFAWVKFANIPVSAVALAATAVPMFLSKRGKGHRCVVIASLCLSFLLLGYIWSIVPKWMDTHTNYNAVFFGILRDGNDAGQALRDMGLPAYMKTLAGTNYYVSGITGITSSERFQRDFSHISKTDIALYYLKHPAVFLKELRIAAKNSGFIRPPYLSNGGINKTRLYFDNSFSIWSEARKKLPLNTLWFNIAVYLAFTVCAGAAVLLMRRRNSHQAGICMEAGLALSLLLGTIFNLCIPVISNGEADLAKHMFAFAGCIDLMLVLIAYSALYSLQGIVRAIRHPSKLAVSAAVVIAVLFLFYSSIRPIKPIYTNSMPVGGLNVLSYVELGEYNGESLLWQVIQRDKYGYTLICSSTIGTHAFSIPVKGYKYGSNLWSVSDIRTWLNNEFYNTFLPEEKELILEYENKYLLSWGNISLKKGGNNEFYWNHLPELADRGYDNAYYSICIDRVFLPDIKDISRAYRMGADIRRDRTYWLETPYYNEDSMVRVVFRDGYIYMKDALLEDIGVVPAIRIKLSEFSGRGTIDRPFHLKK
ncbi:MAG: DUF6273 domain-containing protein [Caulobacteraceae bacterium]